MGSPRERKPAEAGSPVLRTTRRASARAAERGARGLVHPVRGRRLYETMAYGWLTPFYVPPPVRCCSCGLSDHVPLSPLPCGSGTKTSRACKTRAAARQVWAWRKRPRFVDEPSQWRARVAPRAPGRARTARAAAQPGCPGSFNGGRSGCSLSTAYSLSVNWIVSMQRSSLHSQRNWPSSLPNPLRISNARSFTSASRSEWWDGPSCVPASPSFPKKARSRLFAPIRAALYASAR